MSSNIDMAIRALRDASDEQLKKLYLKKKDKPEEEKKEEDELSDEDAALLESILKG